MTSAPKPRGFRLWLLVVAAGAVPALIVVVDLAVYELGDGRIAENEAAVIATLRSLAIAQATFREKDVDGDQTLDYARSLTQLARAGLIDKELGSGEFGGYRFSLSGDTFDWQCSATPLSHRHGARNFVISTNGVVNFSVSPGAATPSSCPPYIPFAKNAPSALGYSSIQ